MKIKDVVYAIGRSGYVNKDLMAAKAGAEADGFIYRGKPVLPGFKKIVQPGTVISVMLLLEDGQVAFGDCADVILTGIAGRDPLFDAASHMAFLETTMRDMLRGQSVAHFRPLAERIDGYSEGGRRLHTALRYGITQALLHAAALSGRVTMAEIVAREYGGEIAAEPLPILASCHKDDAMQLDRMILKRAALLPHASFTIVERDIGLQGEKLLDYATRLVRRIRDIGDADYRPTIHLDVYGTLGELFQNDVARMAEYLGRLAAAVQPFELLIESPVIAKTLEAQIGIFGALKAELRRCRAGVRVIVDEWCNTLEDIRRFADSGAADFVQIKTPDLGGINNAIEAVLYCRTKGMGACLGGTANETDQSARITTHIGLACRPDFLLSKPGLGGDEALMIQTNEMIRTLALIKAREAVIA
ncbi:MAG TPA: methylaspartate ammonia-lyase [Alphaproteobacteria bacterium]|nr:methylaspartate ammonia-lyase [Alphaproteobacteria bacterium]